MRIIDVKFRKNIIKYIFQCILATLTVLAVLIFLDVITRPAIITALGASAFIVFTMPNMYSSDPRRLIGGYSVGIIIGILFFFISNLETFSVISENSKMILVIFGAIAVGVSIFIMAITNTEHAPAAGIALGLVINTWDYITIIFIIIAIIWMTTVKKLLRPYLMDLTSPNVLLTSKKE